MSYPADRVDGFLQVASYINRTLRGTKPVDLPVQTPDQVRVGHQPHNTVTLRTHSQVHARLCASRAVDACGVGYSCLP
jgi:hypothetical protein